MEISAKDVNALRQQTGAGMMDCKKALVEAEGNFEAAIDILRKKGQKIAANREGRDAKEGAVFVKNSADNSVAAIIELNCETDFVARNEDFLSMGDTMAAVAEANRPADLEALGACLMADGRSINEHLTDAMGRIGEKISLSKYALLTGDQVVAYIHPGARVGVVVAFADVNGNVEAVGRDVAMQIAAMSPVAVDKNDVPQDIINKEIEIGIEIARNEGKPEAMLQKIAEGKLQKFFKENTLLSQEFVKDNTQTIEQYIKSSLGSSAKVLAFKRVQLGA